MESRLRFLHRLHAIDEAVTQKDRTSAVMVNRVAKRGWGAVKYTSREAERRRERKEVAKRSSSRWREKLLRRDQAPVPETDTGGRGENPETDGRTPAKELGKMTP